MRFYLVSIPGCLCCQGAAPTPPLTPTPTSRTPTTTPNPMPRTAAPTPTPTPADELGTVLGQAAGVASVKYDMIAAAPGTPTTTAKSWRL